MQRSDSVALLSAPPLLQQLIRTLLLTQTLEYLNIMGALLDVDATCMMSWWPGIVFLDVCKISINYYIQINIIFLIPTKCCKKGLESGSKVLKPAFLINLLLQMSGIGAH